MFWLNLVSRRDFCSLCRTPFSYEHASNSPAVRECGHSNCLDCTRNESRCNICKKRSSTPRILLPNSANEEKRASLIRRLWLMNKEDQERVVIQRQLNSELESVINETNFAGRGLGMANFASLTAQAPPTPELTAMSVAINGNARRSRKTQSAIFSSTLVEAGDDDTARQLSYEEACAELIDAPEESTPDHESSGLFERAVNRKTLE
jgi:hypothetical protein